MRSTSPLSGVVGLGWAKRLILTGEIIEARRALEIGLVTDVVPAATLMVRARELAVQMLRHCPLAVRLAKLAMNASARVDLDSGLLMETLAHAVCYDSEDKQEGTSAFLREAAASVQGPLIRDRPIPCLASGCPRSVPRVRRTADEGPP